MTTKVVKKYTQQNHSTQDSRVVPHRGTNWAVLWLTLQIGRDAVLSESYGRGYTLSSHCAYKAFFLGPYLTKTQALRCTHHGFSKLLMGRSRRLRNMTSSDDYSSECRNSTPSLCHQELRHQDLRPVHTEVLAPLQNGEQTRYLSGKIKQIQHCRLYCQHINQNTKSQSVCS